MNVEEIVAQLDDANEQLVEFLGGCGDFSATVPGDGWTVAAAAHHCAVGYQTAVRWLGIMREGADVPGNPDLHNEGNAAHAEEFANASPDETIDLLRSNCDALVKVLRSLQPDELERSVAHGPAGGIPLTVQQIAGASPRHTLAHLERMRRAFS
jgi:hypothetical protein